MAILNLQLPTVGDGKGNAILPLICGCPSKVDIILRDKTLLNPNQDGVFQATSIAPPRAFPQLDYANRQERDIAGNLIYYVEYQFEYDLTGISPNPAKAIRYCDIKDLCCHDCRGVVTDALLKKYVKSVTGHIDVVNNTDPQNPIIVAVGSVTGNIVNNTDPVHPVVTGVASVTGTAVTGTALNPIINIPPPPPPPPPASSPPAVPPPVPTIVGANIVIDGTGPDFNVGLVVVDGHRPGGSLPNAYRAFGQNSTIADVVFLSTGVLSVFGNQKSSFGTFSTNSLSDLAMAPVSVATVGAGPTFGALDANIANPSVDPNPASGRPADYNYIVTAAVNLQAGPGWKGRLIVEASVDGGANWNQYAISQISVGAAVGNSIDETRSIVGASAIQNMPPGDIDTYRWRLRVQTLTASSTGGDSINGWSINVTGSIGTK